MSESSALPETVLCIPGPWADRSQLIERIVRSSSGYIFAGRVLLNMQTHDSFELQHEPHDERMQAAFIAAGPHWINTPGMTDIKDHMTVVYLIGYGGSRKNVEALMLAARALLDAGGLGVKVESSGLAHSPAAWRNMCAELHLFSAHRAFVLNLTGPDVYSCGMHNFGMKDAIVENFNALEAVELVRTFTWYMFTEEPALRSGQTFSVSASAPVYRVTADPGVGYEEGSLFANPYGFWRLAPE